MSIFGMVPAMSETPADRLHQLRVERKLSMARLAQLVVPATTPTTINKLEKGEIDMSPEWGKKLASALGVDPLEFLGRLAELSQRETAVVALYRGLSEPGKQAIYRVIDEMAQPKAVTDEKETQ